MIGVYIFGVGAIIGSFLNVLIYRLPRNEKFISGRSHCTSCGAVIKWYDNIPILSFLILKGRCRSCRSPISWCYPLVELAAAGFFLLSYLLYGFGFQMAIAGVLFALLLVVTLVDFRHYIIPDKITIPGIVLGLASSFVNPSVTPLSSLAGIVAGGASLYLLAIAGDYLFKKESLGGGDVKLAAMLGAFLGWKNIIIIFFGAALLGLIYALGQMAFSAEARRSRTIPFGPFLSLAGLIAFFFGESLINFYLEKVLQVG